MARLSTARLAGPATIALFASLFASGCQQSLALKAEVVAKVAAAAASADPALSLSQGTVAIAPAGNFELGHETVGQSKDTTFTVANPGGATLALSGAPGITGTNAAEFSIQALSSTNIAPGATATFAIRFSPASVGPKAATVTIASNAAVFALAISATGDAAPTPSIQLTQGATVIASGGGFGLGHATVGVPADTVFTITNNGGAALTLSGNPGITGTNASEFSVQALSASNIAAGATATFAIRFSPATAGAKSASVTIASNAAAFAFAISATGDPAPAPQLTLLDGAAPIAAGGSATWPNTIFGTASPKVFTIKNTGTANLVLAGGPNYVAITGGAGQAAYGSLVQPVALTIAPNGTTTFSVSFAPPAPDTAYAVDFVVNTNDPTNAAFAFHGAGTSTQWHGSTTISSSATSAFFYSPKIAIAPSSAWQSPTLPTLIAAYHNAAGIYLSISRDGGKTWPTPLKAVASTTVTALTFGVSGNVHLFYLDSSTNTLKYTTASTTSLIGNALADYTTYFATNYLGSFPNSSFYMVKNSNVVIANSNVYIAYYNSTSAKLSLAVRSDVLPTMGIPAFTLYDLTAVNSKTGGDFPSLQVNGTKLYVTYGDATKTTVAVVTLSTIATASSYLYYVINDNGVGRSLWSSNLAIDGSKAYSLWRLDGGSPLKSSVSTDLNLSSWSATPTTITGESTSTISAAPAMSLALSGGSLYAAFVNSAGIRMLSSANSGASWSGQWLDTDSSFASTGSEVYTTASGAQVYVVYVTQSASHPNKYSITLMKSLDGGATW